MKLYAATTEQFRADAQMHRIVEKLSVEEVAQIGRKPAPSEVASLGYEDAVVTGKSGDGGVDARATLRLRGITSVPTGVQAKRWANNVGGDIVQQLRVALHVDERGVVITTSAFTKAAHRRSRCRGQVADWHRGWRNVG